MEKLIAHLFSLSLMLMVSGCKGQDSPLTVPNPVSKTSIVTFDIYKGGIDNGLSIIYLSRQAILLVKSNGVQSLDFHNIPPPPPKEAGVGMASLNVEPIKAEVLNLEESTVKEIESLITSFDVKDLSSVINNAKIDDGIGIKITISYDEKETIDFTLINGATEKQREFLRYVFDSAIEKSKYNTEQLKLFIR